MSAPATGPRLLVIGAGLMGTSVALAAAAAGYAVTVDDRDAERVAAATALGAGEPRRGGAAQRWDLAVVAVPPLGIGQVAKGLIERDLAGTVTHLGSVQALPQREVELFRGSLSRFVGSHPIAGGERSGPGHASADLFRDRPWVICPAADSHSDAVRVVAALARDCGSSVVTMSAHRHDALFAQLSHVPQLVASALAAAMVGLEPKDADLAGMGLRDTSRLADSDPGLWAEIVGANRAPVAAALRRVLAPLQGLATDLDTAEPADASPDRTVHDLVARGQRGRHLFSGKHGRRAVPYASVDVVVPDSPGTLARLLADAARSGVNVEDIRVDHATGQPLGIVSLAVAPDGQAAVTATLSDQGWTVTSAPAPTA